MASSGDASAAADRGLRADAEANRVRILTAASAVLAESGIDTPMTEVARRAGVGIATAFRHFPTRELLLSEVFAEKMESYAEAVELALAEDDGWQGFRHFVERAAQMQARDLGFNRVLMMSFPSAERFEAARERAEQGFRALTARAKATGRLRRDFVHQDLGIVLMANAGLIGTAGNLVPEASGRLISYLLQAFETVNPAPLPPAPREGALRDALCAHAERRRDGSS